MDQRWDLLLTNATVATLTGESGYGLIEAGGIGIDGGRIVWVGDLRELPGDPVQLASQRRSLGGALVTPGLIDCHTHLVFAGDRADEFEKRLNGISYEEIAKAGGGIRSTVTKTRAASEEDLFDASVVRARALVAEGVTTLEIKSGYGLDLDSERRMLKVARRIGRVLGINVRTTFLGAHTLPQEFAGRADDYIDHLAAVVLPELAGEGLVDAVDGFCERIAFSNAQMRRIFERATALNLPVKLHAEQLSNSHGAALVAEFGGLSADHLEHLDDAGVAAMAEAGTVAVILPGSYYCLRETRQPPIAALRAAGVPMAVSTDLNPGTSPLLSLRLAMNQSSILFRMTPDEALRGTTINAARALGLSTTKGRIAPGNDADLAIWNLRHPAELAYWVGGNPLREVMAAGRTVRA